MYQMASANVTITPMRHTQSSPTRKPRPEQAKAFERMLTADDAPRILIIFVVSNTPRRRTMISISRSVTRMAKIFKIVRKAPTEKRISGVAGRWAITAASVRDTLPLEDACSSLLICSGP